MSRVGIRASILALVTAGIAAFAGPASAATINVGCTPENATSGVQGLRAAITTANASPATSDTINLASNCTYSISTVVGTQTGTPIVTSPVIIDGNGSTITRTGATNLRLLLAFNGNLTLNNLTLSNARLVGNNENGAAVAGANSPITLNNVTATGNSVAKPVSPATTPSGLGGAVGAAGGTVTVNGGSYTGNTGGIGGAFGLSGAPAAISGTTQISGNNAVNGAGVYATASPVTMGSGTTISGNSATIGAGVYAANSNLTVNGSAITGNTATSFGGGIYGLASVAPAATLALHGANIANNNAGNGGGLTSGGNNVTIDNSTTFTNNKTTGQGGGLYLQQTGTVAITNSSLTGNEATSTTSNGGGIYALIAPLTISGSSLTLNKANGVTPSPSPGFLYGGGGIFAHTGAVTVTGGSLLGGNTANGSAGGGIDAAAAAPTTLTDTALIGNSAVFGGGINAQTSQIDATGATFATNTVNGWGGGINATSGAVNLTRSSVAANSTTGAFFGAGITAALAPVTAKRSSVTGNTGGSYGTAAYIAGGTSLFENSTVANNSTAPSSNNTAGGILVTAAGNTLGRVDVSNSTFADNGLGGSTAPGASLVPWSNSSASNPGPAEVHLHNTVVADTDSTDLGAGCVGLNGAAVTQANLIDEGGNVEYPTSTCPGALHGADTKLAPLAADPGQPTSSLRPLPGSSAIDAGTGACPATDQRGTTRPNGEGCDAGAYETPAAPDTTAALIGADPTKDPQFTLGSPTGVSFECRKDNAGAWTACTSPYAPEPPLFSDGAHSIQARALDADGYFDQSPASVSFTVDHTPPAVTVNPVGVTGDTTPDITFTVGSDASPPVSVTCQVDAGPVTSPCTSPYTPAALSPGTHTVTVTATDGVGNVGSDSDEFTVDTAPPDTIIDSGPTGIFEPGKTNDSTPTFTFHSTKAGSTFQCKVDNGAFAPCTSPYTTPFLADGPHTFSVVATDNVNNTDPTPATSSFTVAPKCTLLGLSLNPLGIPIKICLIEVRSAKAGAKSKTRIKSYGVRLSRDGKSYLTGSVSGRKVKTKRTRRIAAGIYGVRVTAKSATGRTLLGSSTVYVDQKLAKRLNK